MWYPINHFIITLRRLFRFQMRRPYFKVRYSILYSWPVASFQNYCSKQFNMPISTNVLLIITQPIM